LSISNHGVFHAIRISVTALAVTVVSTVSAVAEKRIALIVGNQTYGSVSSLDNPVADATLMAETLRGVGFDVTLLTDTDQVTMVRGIAQFGRELRDGGEDTTGLFYYAGHGVQSFGTNFLLPVDARLTDAADLSLVGVRAEAVLRQMASAKNKTNIVILDACRNNPFEAIADMNDNGLAEMKAPTGTFLSYSTAPGLVAVDGAGNNSPFTRALAQAMPVQGVPIEQVFKSVRVAVLENTSGQQTPWDTSSLTQDFFFVEAPQMTAEQIAAKQLWDSVKISRDAVQILLFLRANPDGPYTAEAREMLSQVMAEEASGGATTAATKPADAVPTPSPAAPAASEKDLIEVARSSGKKEDYEAYLEVYPTGVYSELARFELEIIEKKMASTDPISENPTPAAPTESTPVATAAPAAPSGANEAISFLNPLGSFAGDFAGQSLSQLITGSPLFPPVEGLPPEYWKDQKCSSCHQWTQEALCTQARTYLKESGTRALDKQHPYGGFFKNSLKSWAGDDCP